MQLIFGSSDKCVEDKWEFMCVFIFQPQMTRMTQILYFFLYQ